MSAGLYLLTQDGSSLGAQQQRSEVRSNGPRFSGSPTNGPSSKRLDVSWCLVRLSCSDPLVRRIAKSLPTGTQLEVARQSDVKLRLGRTSRQGQKGVDGLIIHDLITHAYRRTIDDAVVISGDEDLLDAIESAQANGTRVHLLEIPIGGIAEAMLRAFDKIAEIDGEFFDQFFTQVEPEPEAAPSEELSENSQNDSATEGSPTAEISRQPAPPKEKPKWMNLPLRPVEDKPSRGVADVVKLGEVSDKGATFAEEWMHKARGDERAELLASRPYLADGLDVELLRFAAGDRWLSESERRALRDAFWNRLAEG